MKCENNLGLGREGLKDKIQSVEMEWRMRQLAILKNKFYLFLYYYFSLLRPRSISTSHVETI